MNEKIIKRLGNLLSVKSIVTLVLTGVFAYMSVAGKISQDFMTIYAVIIAFYFGTQSQKVQDAVDTGSTGGGVRPMGAIQRVLTTARSEIGYLEKATNAFLEDKTANAGYNNWNKFAAFLDDLEVVYNFPKNGYAWCDIFIDYCFIYTFGLTLGMAMLFQPEKGAGAGCTYSMGYYKKAGRFYTDPQPGDQVFFSEDGGASSYHTGLVEKVEGGRVYTIEGNTSSAAGVVANGGAVRDKSYSRSYNKIAGYGRPDWTLVKEEDDMEITQDKFNEMFKVAMAAYRAELQDNDCGNYSAEGRQYVVDKGLIVGGAPLADGSPNYMWQDFLTREQFATVLYRHDKALGLV